MVGRARKAAVITAEVRTVLGVETGVHLILAAPRPVGAAIGPKKDAAADGPAIAPNVPFAAEAGLVVPMARLAPGVPRLPAPHAEGVVLEVLGPTPVATPSVEGPAPGVEGAAPPSAIDRANGLVPAGLGPDPVRAAVGASGQAVLLVEDRAGSRAGAGVVGQGPPLHGIPGAVASGPIEVAPRPVAMVLEVARVGGAAPVVEALAVARRTDVVPGEGVGARPMEAVLRQTPRRVPAAAGEALATPAEAGLRAGRPSPSFGGRDPKGAAQGPGPAQEGGALRLVAVALPAARPAVEPVPVARGRITPVQGQGVPTALAVGAKGEEGPVEDPAPRPIGLAATARAATQVPAPKG